jgi:hypothetical protein
LICCDVLHSIHKRDGVQRGQPALNHAPLPARLWVKIEQHNRERRPVVRRLKIGHDALFKFRLIFVRASLPFVCAGCGVTCSFAIAENQKDTGREPTKIRSTLPPQGTPR